MAFEWDNFQDTGEAFNSSSLFYELDIPSLESSDVNSGGLLIDPALENPNLTNTGPLIWDLPEKEQEGSSNQEHGLEIKALHSPSSEQALNNLRSEFRKLIDEQEIRWEKKLQALEQQTRSEIQALTQKLDKIKIESESELVKFCTEIDTYLKKLRAWATEAKLCVDKVVELQTD